MFQKGFRLETIEDAEEAKGERGNAESRQRRADAVTPQPGEPDHSIRHCLVGNINPDEFYAGPASCASGTPSTNEGVKMERTKIILLGNNQMEARTDIIVSWSILFATLSQF
nr:hypothetical protein [Enterobacter hormaechei]